MYISLEKIDNDNDDDNMINNFVVIEFLTNDTNQKQSLLAAYIQIHRIRWGHPVEVISTG